MQSHKVGKTEIGIKNHPGECDRLSPEIPKGLYPRNKGEAETDENLQKWKPP